VTSFLVMLASNVSLLATYRPTHIKIPMKFTCALLVCVAALVRSGLGQVPIITHPPPGWPPPPHPPVDHQPPKKSKTVVIERVPGLSKPVLLVPTSVPLPQNAVTLSLATSVHAAQTPAAQATQWPHSFFGGEEKVAVERTATVTNPLLLVPEAMEVPDRPIIEPQIGQMQAGPIRHPPPLPHPPSPPDHGGRPPPRPPTNPPGHPGPNSPLPPNRPGPSHDHHKNKSQKQSAPGPTATPNA
jgi:hypothetical protein